MNYLLRTAMARKEITSKSGGSTRYNVGQDILSEVKVVLPTLPEQQKIADFLSSADKKIDLLKQKKEKLKEYKKGLLQQIFSQQRRFKDEQGNPFPDWEEKRLGEVGDIVTGSTPRTSEKQYYKNGYLPFVSPADIRSREIKDTYTKVTELGFSKGRKVRKGATYYWKNRPTIGRLHHKPADKFYHT